MKLTSRDPIEEHAGFGSIQLNSMTGSPAAAELTPDLATLAMTDSVPHAPDRVDHELPP